MIPTPPNQPASARFVVLRHDELGGGHHFDLMIEQGVALATWKCTIAPEHVTTTPLVVQRLPNHRVHYLTYEGPISGDRGSVMRYDEGTCLLSLQSETEWMADFTGKHLVGRFSFRLLDPAVQSWSLAACPKCEPSG